MATALIDTPPHLAGGGDDRLFEIVDGRRRAKSMGAYEVDIMSMIGMYLGHHSLTHQLGRVEVEMLFHFGNPDLPQRRPDVAFVSFQKWPKGRRIPSDQAWNVVPDLAVEVVSPTNSANEVEGRSSSIFGPASGWSGSSIPRRPGSTSTTGLRRSWSSRETVNSAVATSCPDFDCPCRPCSRPSRPDPEARLRIGIIVGRSVDPGPLRCSPRSMPILRPGYAWSSSSI